MAGDPPKEPVVTDLRENPSHDNMKRSRAERGKQRSQLRTARVDDMFLTFLGTSSGAPSTTRNQQALMLQLCGETWLFDCGEASQHRLFGFSSLRSSGVKRIFISHLHGDHCFGLPGMLCNMAVSYGGGEDGEGEVDELARTHLPVEIVGPQGLRSWLRVVLGNSYATLGQMNIIVHELVGMSAIEHGPPRFAPPYTVDRPLPNELPGMNIEPNGNGTWSVPLREHEPPVDVSAVELDHTVPTVGWVVTEAPRAGSVDSKKLLPVLREHGIDRKAVASIKAGTPLQLPDGSFLQPSDYVQPSTQRKLAILSDMRKPKGARSDIIPLLQNATLFIHECTNAYLPDVKFSGGKSEADVERKAFRHGHSTPQVAGRLAHEINAQHLVLTHFSPRYTGDQSNSSRIVMGKVSALAERALNAGRQQRDRRPVTAALDLMQFRVRIDGGVEVSNPVLPEGNARNPAVGGRWGRVEEPAAADAEASRRWAEEMAQVEAEAESPGEVAAEEEVRKADAAEAAAAAAAAADGAAADGAAAVKRNRGRPRRDGT